MQAKWEFPYDSMCTIFLSFFSLSRIFYYSFVSIALFSSGHFSTYTNWNLLRNKDIR